MDISDAFLISIILVMHMLKYVNTDIVFQEIPNETTLAINISNCPCHCKGCHSAYLAEDIGEPLIYYNNQSNKYITSIDEIIENNIGITCVSIMGGDSEPNMVNALAQYIKDNYDYSLKTAWYSGRQELAKEIELRNFNFIKLGPYIKELGGLKSPTTNQRLYEVKMCKEVDEKGNPIYGLEDITNMFWK